MKTLKHSDLFLPSACLSFEACQAYVKEDLNESLTAKVEAHLAQCELCRGAVEGLKMARNSVDMNTIVGSLNNEVLKRAAERKQDQVIPKGVSRGTRWAWVSAAASVIIIGLFSFYFYNLNRLPFNDVAEGYVPVRIDRGDVFQLPEPQIEMKRWYGEAVMDDQQDEVAYEEEDAFEEVYEQDEEVSPEEDIAIVEDEVSYDEDRLIEDQAAKKPAMADTKSPEPLGGSENEPIVTAEKRSTKDMTATKSLSSQATHNEISTVNSGTVNATADRAFVSEEIKFEPAKPEPIFTVVEKMPSFPGGKDALQEYLSSNYRLPDEFIGSGIDSTIYLEFVVDPNGNTRMIELISGVSPKADRQAVRLIRKMPPWEAGMHRGQNVAVRMNAAVPVKDPSIDQ